MWFCVTWLVPSPTTHAASADGVTGLPADITPLLSLAGIWQPISNQYIDQTKPSRNTGTIVGPYAGNIVLRNGMEGIAVTGWSHSRSENSAISVTPVTLAIFEQQADGTLQLATAKYTSDAKTQGGNNVLIADFNQDGVQDIFLPAHNESPAIPAASTAYLSGPGGTYAKVPIADRVEAHGATLASIDGTPTVFTANYYTSGPPDLIAGTAVQYGPPGFTVVPNIGTSGNSSVAVADFYGDGRYSLVCGDCVYGPGFPYDPSSPDHRGIMLWNLAGLSLSGSPHRVGIPYFNGKPQYARYPSYTDPFKTHSYRAWVDDFNHDGKVDVVVQAAIWSQSAGVSKSILQMLQNRGGYSFTDVTDALNAQYDQDCDSADYIPQIRDIDHSGIDSWLSGSSATGRVHPAANYILVNDGTGGFHVALHETLNGYASQIYKWLDAHPQLKAQGFYVGSDSPGTPAMRAYMTSDGRINFVALVGLTRNVNPALPLWVTQYVAVNMPLRLDIAAQFKQAITIRDRNGSHLIRTFAGDDTVYSGNDGSYCKIDGGLGTNTVVYAGPARNYSATKNSDASWTVKDNVGANGTDTLFRIQRLQFSDAAVRLDAVGGPANAPVIAEVVNGASFQPGIVAGSWVTIRGQNLAGVSRAWNATDFGNGSALPTNLSGVQVSFNGRPAAVYYVSPTQLNVQAPAGLSGAVSVQAHYFGASNSFSVGVTQSSPGLFTYQLGSRLFPAAVYNGTSILVGDPAAAGSSVRKARPGDIVQLYATGIEPSPAGAVLSVPLAVQSQIAVTIGPQGATVLGAALVFPGEFQINIVVPNVPDGDNPLKISVGSQSSQSGVIIPIGQ